MNSLLVLLTPPILGAFIGYLTNYVAIRMLFRPLRPWRLLGMPVPMTPGVIPRRRALLAENIGKMVGGHLLTGSDVRRALAEEDFQRQLRTLVEERLDSLMLRELGPPAALVPEQFRPYFDTGVKILKWRLSRHLHTFLDSDGFSREVSQVVDRRLEAILATELDHWLDGEARTRLSDRMGEAAGRLLAGEWFDEQVRNYLEDRFAAFIAEERTPADLLPAGLLRLLLDKVEKEAPSLLAKIAEHLEEPDMQDRIARAIGGALGNFMGSLGPLSAMLGNFLNPELVDQKIRSYLAAHRGDFTRWQADQALRQKMSSLLRGKLEQLLATPLSSLIGRAAPEKVAVVREELATQLLQLLRRPKTAAFLGGLLRDGLERQADRPLEETLAGLTGREELDRSSSWTRDQIVSLLRSPESRKLLDRMISGVLDQHVWSRPIGSMADFLPKAVQEGIRDYLLAQIGDLLIREVPNLVDSLNVQQMVAGKVNSLDLLKLEGLLLGIMQEQFKYINIFGALLGFMIGSLNLLLILAR